MTTPKIGTLFFSGVLLRRRTWEVERITPKMLILRELEWSRDVVNENGVMYRTSNTIRVKMGNYLRKPGIGFLDVLLEKREVRDRAAITQP